MNVKRATLLAAAGLCLLSMTACESQEADTDRTVVIDEDVDTSAGGASIMRPDMAVERPVETPAPRPYRATIPFGDVEGDDFPEEVAERLNAILSAPAMELGGDIVLRGHSDAGGTDEANMRASRQRAERVEEWLVERGVDEDRISIIAFGEQNPIRPNALSDGTPNEEGRLLNQRVEVTVNLPVEASDDRPGADDGDDAA